MIAALAVIAALLAEAAATADPVTVIGGVLLAAITALNAGQTAQMSGLRHDFQTYRDAQDRRVKALEELVAEHAQILLGGPKKKTASHSTTRGRTR